LKSFKKGSKELSVDHLNEYFMSFNSVVKDLISATDKTQIYTAEIADLKPTNQWFKDNVCLIGDAAHAATPNMGQGACQAIEDAYVLAACLSRQEPNMAFEEFHNIRKEKVNLVVKTSWRIGKISHFSNPIAIGVRNLLVRMAPESMNKKQLEQIFKIPSL
jgi:2-polyprenyl-6-methoxyphenol hydroxylase-like FAD-dependent oxidoreductase